MSATTLEMWESFIEVAREASVTGASRAIGVSPATVSRRLASLERELGTELLTRTSRSVSLTEAGRDALPLAEQILADVEELEALAADSQQQARGVLRVGAGISVMQELLAPLLCRFLSKHPGLCLRLELSDRHVSIVEEGLDVVIRVGDLPDGDLRMRQLGEVEHVVVASPRWLACHGEPTTPAQLARATAVIDTNQPRRWRLQRGQEQVSIEPDGRVYVNHAHTVRTAVLGGMGPALCPSFVVRRDLAAGLLERLLPEWDGPRLPLSALYAGSRHPPAKVRAWIDFLVTDLNDFS